MRLPIILAVLLVAAPGLALANAGGTKPPGVVEGPARIIDGDTLDIAGQAPPSIATMRGSTGV